MLPCSIVLLKHLIIYYSNKKKGIIAHFTGASEFTNTVCTHFFIYAERLLHDHSNLGLLKKVEELMLLNCGVGEDSGESLGLQGDPTSPS